MSSGGAVNSVKVAAWAKEFFAKNPGASTNQCLKAMNNARIPPLSDLVKRIHLEHQRKKLASMLDHPAKDSGPGGAQPISPAHDDEKENPMPPPPIAPVKPLITPPPSAQAKEKEVITAPARALLAAMRQLGCDSCTITIIDDGVKPVTEFKLTYRQAGGGSLDL
ncbi:MAG: hypothetical protein Q8L48_16640 [Archangium sp.]|nr:hypothetical protein [Archangium sp.]